MGTLGQPFAPCTVKLDGVTLDPAGWSYDASNSVLSASFKARGEATLTAWSECDPAQPAVNKKTKKKKKKKKKRTKRR